MKNDCKARAGVGENELKPPQVKHEISPNKFQEWFGFCLHRQ